MSLLPPPKGGGAAQCSEIVLGWCWLKFEDDPKNLGPTVYMPRAVILTWKPSMFLDVFSLTIRCFIGRREEPIEVY